MKKELNLVSSIEGFESKRKSHVGFLSCRKRVFALYFQWQWGLHWKPNQPKFELQMYHCIFMLWIAEIPSLRIENLMLFWLKSKIYCLRICRLCILVEFLSMDIGHCANSCLKYLVAFEIYAFLWWPNTYNCLWRETINKTWRYLENMFYIYLSMFLDFLCQKLLLYNSFPREINRDKKSCSFKSGFEFITEVFCLQCK